MLNLKYCASHRCQHTIRIHGGLLYRYDSENQRSGSMVMNGLLEVAWKNGCSIYYLLTIQPWFGKGMDTYTTCKMTRPVRAFCERKFYGALNGVADLLRLEVLYRSTLTYQNAFSCKLLVSSC